MTKKFDPSDWVGDQVSWEHAHGLTPPPDDSNYSMQSSIDPHIEAELNYYRSTMRQTYNRDIPNLKHDLAMANMQISKQNGILNWVCFAVIVNFIGVIISHMALR